MSVLCKNLRRGYCPYGWRCDFSHTGYAWFEQARSNAEKGICVVVGGEVTNNVFKSLEKSMGGKIGRLDHGRVLSGDRKNIEPFAVVFFKGIQDAAVTKLCSGQYIPLGNGVRAQLLRCKPRTSMEQREYMLNEEKNFLK
mgnify:CR=1 FL=1